MNKKVAFKERPILYLVAPCYNEEEGIYANAQIMLNKLLELEKEKYISKKSKILFVNDGSKDNTEKIICDLIKENDKFALVSFLNNSGHQNAIYAGMMTAKDYADIVVTIDADLQQDINKLSEFIDKYKEGNDVVYGVRNDRSSDNIVKKTTASIYYGFMKLMGSNLLKNSADYRLLSKRVLKVLSNYKESNLFLRGLIPTMGFKSDVVYFDVKEREAGKSKYTFKKMFTLAIDGITSFSATPIHLICFIGLLVSGSSLIATFISLLKIALNINSNLFRPLVFLLFGIVIISIGVVGEYVSNTFMQVKERPRYLIDYIIIKEDKGK